jgi:hypothetical protein
MSDIGTAFESRNIWKRSNVRCILVNQRDWQRGEWLRSREVHWFLHPSAPTKTWVETWEKERRVPKKKHTHIIE